eukprot:1115441-Prymnesium_polylepis.2
MPHACCPPIHAPRAEAELLHTHPPPAAERSSEPASNASADACCASECRRAGNCTAAMYSQAGGCQLLAGALKVLSRVRAGTARASLWLVDLSR